MSKKITLLLSGHTLISKESWLRWDLEVQAMKGDNAHFYMDCIKYIHRNHVV